MRKHLTADDIRKMRAAFITVDGNPGPFPKGTLRQFSFMPNNSNETRITIDAVARKKLLQMHQNLADECVAMTLVAERATQAFVQFGLSLKALISARRGAPARRRSQMDAGRRRRRAAAKQ